MSSDFFIFCNLTHILLDFILSLISLLLKFKFSKAQ